MTKEDCTDRGMQERKRQTNPEGDSYAILCKTQRLDAQRSSHY